MVTGIMIRDNCSGFRPYSHPVKLHKSTRSYLVKIRTDYTWNNWA